MRQEHVDTWLSVEVKEQLQDMVATENLDNKIRSFYRDWEKKNKSNKIPMNYLSEKLRKLLQENLCNQEDVI